MAPLLVPAESWGRTVMAWDESPESHLPLSGPLSPHCPLSRCSLGPQWETDLRPAACRTPPPRLRRCHSFPTRRLLRHVTLRSLDGRPTSCRHGAFPLLSVLVSPLDFRIILLPFLIFSIFLKKWSNRCGSISLHGPSKLLLTLSNSTYP